MIEYIKGEVYPTGPTSYSEIIDELSGRIAELEKRLSMYEKMKELAGSSCNCGRPWPWQSYSEEELTSA